MEERSNHENSHDILDPSADASREGSAPLTAENTAPSGEPTLPEANEAPSGSTEDDRNSTDAPESADVSSMAASMSLKLPRNLTPTVVSPPRTLSALISSGRLETAIQRLVNRAVPASSPSPSLPSTVASIGECASSRRSDQGLVEAQEAQRLAGKATEAASSDTSHRPSTTTETTPSLPSSVCTVEVAMSPQAGQRVSEKSPAPCLPSAASSTADAPEAGSSPVGQQLSEKELVGCRQGSVPSAVATIPSTSVRTSSPKAAPLRGSVRPDILTQLLASPPSDLNTAGYTTLTPSSLALPACNTRFEPPLPAPAAGVPAPLAAGMPATPDCISPQLARAISSWIMSASLKRSLSIFTGPPTSSPTKTSDQSDTPQPPRKHRKSKKRILTHREHVGHFRLGSYSLLKELTDSHPYYCVPAITRSCTSDPTSLYCNAMLPISDDVIRCPTPSPEPEAKCAKIDENPTLTVNQPAAKHSKKARKSKNKTGVTECLDGQAGSGAAPSQPKPPKVAFKAPKPPKSSPKIAYGALKWRLREVIESSVSSQKSIDNKQLDDLYDPIRTTAAPVFASTFTLKVGHGHKAQTLADIVVSHDLAYQLSDIEKNMFPLCVLHTILHNEGPSQTLNVIKAWEKHELLSMLPYPTVEKFFKRETTVKYNGTSGLFNKPKQTAQRNAAFLTTFASGHCFCEGGSCFVDFAPNAWSLLTEGQQKRLTDFCESFDFVNYFAD